MFIADTFNNRAVEVLAGSATQITVPTNGLSHPYGLALDAACDLFIADSGNNRVVEVLAGSGTQITVPINGLVELPALRGECRRRRVYSPEH